MKKIMNIIGSVIIISIVACWFTGLYLFIDDYSKQLDDAKTKLSESNKTLDTVQSELKQVQYDYQLESERATQLSNDLKAANNELANVKSDLDVANVTIDDLKSSEYKFVYIGDFKLTHYCPGYHGEPCGTGNGLTATGTTVTAGRTIAVDTNVIPYGTTVYIEGYGWRTAEDCGGGVKGNHIDIAVGSHDEAISSGKKNGGVWILVKNS